MAVQITLVRGATTIDLTTGTDDIWLADNGWIRTVAQRGEDGEYPSSVPESILCRVKAASQDAIDAVVQGVNDILRQGGDFMENPIDANPVYLRVQTKDGSTAWQALVKGGLAMPNSSMFDPPYDYGLMLSEIIIELTRGPFWEPTSTTPFAKSLTSNGSMSDYGAAPIPGNVPARIEQLFITASSDVSMSEEVEHWVGFRTDRFGDRTQFVPIWELEDADDLQNNTAVVAGDATASGTSKIRWTPGGGADNLMLTRAIIMVNDVSANQAEQRGDFAIVLRAACTGTQTYRVRISQGIREGPNWDVRSRVPIEVHSNNWFLYNMGEVSFPNVGRASVYASQDTLMSTQAIRIEAEVETAGTGVLDMDCFIVMPIAEGFLHIKGTKAIDLPTELVRFWTEPDDTYSAVVDSGTLGNIAPQEIPEADRKNWGLPPGAGSIVYAGQDVDVHRLDDGVSVGVVYKERWRAVGGAG